MGTTTLITGGVRSGKSAFALSSANAQLGVKAFIATAIPFDHEMCERIANHQAERGDTFLTIEEPYNLPEAVDSIDCSIKVAVIDCLTVWLGNLFYKYNNDVSQIKNCIEKLVDSLRKCHAEIFLVTNEVGWGIVPENEMSRLFRDCNGFMNQKIAAFADKVILCTCGISIKIKG